MSITTHTLSLRFKLWVNSADIEYINDPNSERLFKFYLPNNRLYKLSVKLDRAYYHIVKAHDNIKYTLRLNFLKFKLRKYKRKYVKTILEMIL